MPRAAPAWWASRGLGACLALPLAGLFYFIAAARQLAYRRGWLASHAAPVPVVVVGNVAVGGSGKTPLVIHLVAALRARGWHPAVISRGYGGTGQGLRAVAANSDPVVMGDEPVLIARLAGCPVFVGADRVALAQAVCRAHPEVNVLIADDGLQHYRLQRDFELVVIDPASLGNGFLLPAGPLREPLSRVRRAQYLLWHGEPSEAMRAAVTGTASGHMHLEPGDFYRLSSPTQRATAIDLAALRLRAVAGIGQPQRFFATLRSMGLKPQRCDAFADHHAFSADDLALGDCNALLMTEKDAIKCAALVGPATWVLPVEAKIPTQAVDAIEAVLRQPRQTH